MSDETKAPNAELRFKDGRRERVHVPPFPKNPELVVADEGMLAWGLRTTHYFLAQPIGFGKGPLGYNEVEAFTLGAVAR